MLNDYFSLLLKHQKFKRFESEVTDIFRKTISNNICKNEIQIIKELTRNLDNFTKKIVISKANLEIDIDIEAKFIHGNMFRAEFIHNSKKIIRELGDMIFINKLLFNNRKYFERYTITQFKKAKKKNKIITSWEIEPEQLYLLNNFPEFKFYNKNIATKSYYLPNCSKCQGSYGLLPKNNADEFIFIAAPLLDIIKEERKSIRMQQILNATNEKAIAYLAMIVLGKNYSCLLTNNVSDFVHNYLSLKIGEVTVCNDILINKDAADFLNEILSFIHKFKTYKYTTLRKGVTYLKCINDINGESFDKNKEENFENKGFGVINITMRMNEINKD